MPGTNAAGSPKQAPGIGTVGVFMSSVRWSGRFFFRGNSNFLGFAGTCVIVAIPASGGRGKPFQTAQCGELSQS